MSIKFKSVLFVLTLLMLFMSSASATCVRDGNGAVLSEDMPSGGPGAPLVLQDSNGWGDACGAIPDAYTVNFFKLGICTTPPSFNDLSSCQFILNSSTGVPHEIKFPAESALATGDFSIAAGTYGYTVLLLSTKLGITHTENFSEPLVGASGTGTTCWTNGKMTSLSGNSYNHTDYGMIFSSSPTSPALECGSAGSASPVISYEIIDTFNECDGQFSGAATYPMSDGSATVDLLQNNGTSPASNCDNASKLFWSTALNTPLIVTSDSNFIVSFKLTDAVSIDGSADPITGDGVAVKMGADPFQLNITTQ